MIPASAGMRQRLEILHEIAGRQIFFVGGAPRSGTTWLQQMLNANPEVSCAGEGMFWRELMEPVEKLVFGRRAAIEDKNATLFQHSGGYPLPDAFDADTLIGVGVLLGFQRQIAMRGNADAIRAVGEKTPENVFVFPRLRGLFPTARLIGIARDPRDTLASSWHMFCRGVPEARQAAAKDELIARSLPSIEHGARMLIAFQEQDPRTCALVTYERLTADTPRELARLFRHLGVRDDAGTTAGCIAACAFDRQSGGRARGEADSRAFLRRGVVGDWRSTFTEAQGKMITDRLGWMYPYFGWRL
ncbi:sulfotransferase family protein [Tanticharoenia sakaeratensis]|uniref:Sulfotransferase n=1 Tax=Tanticharoenia sakaeratensis NBRC 103193 TaxID=1231623 RepID=A0A0D6MGF7_9PROT|nr:sulfotransferase [Tanticharoenia sakaeratensis]GAN52722.1 sulfotransferase [Tanticharoenia sakaeratensis NBRC 103193]GBQ17834.1 sulfotransferase [Tanticharoenia sakaeratensis NBRC 103193]